MTESAQNYLQNAIHLSVAGNSHAINHIGWIVLDEQQRVIRQISSRGFWFVDIPRTSSTAIGMLLGEAFGAPFGKSNIPGGKPVLGTSSFLLPPHTPAFNLRELLGSDLWAGLASFSVVRDPYTWSASLWRFTHRYGGLEMPSDTFGDFLKELHLRMQGPRGNRAFFPTSYCQSDYVLSLDDEMLVGDILKFEDRDAIESHLAGLGITKPLADGLAASDGADRDLGASEKRLVHTIFEKDFDLLGY
ncbi:MAG: hypothetical protein ACKVH7_15940 [Alphaproteobacteria bacterium]|jgi:hypothetical protein